MDRFASEAEGRVQEFSQQNLANMAWAFGKLTHDAPSLLDAIGLKATTIVKVAYLFPIIVILCSLFLFIFICMKNIVFFTKIIILAVVCLQTQPLASLHRALPCAL